MKSASLLLLLGSVALGGCTYSVHQAAVGGENGIPAGARVRLIESSASKNVILGIGGETDFVDEAWQGLLAQCPGEIFAVETRYSTAHNFLSYDDNIRMTGLCLDPSAPPVRPVEADPPLPTNAPPPSPLADQRSFKVGDRVLVDMGGRSVPAEILQAPGDAYFLKLDGEAAGRWVQPAMVKGPAE